MDALARRGDVYRRTVRGAAPRPVLDVAGGDGDDLAVVGGGDDEADLVAKRNAACPTGAMGDAWDIAWASVFLASDEARYINGVLLPVDGGMTCKIQ